jgi:hypothetical protein
VAFGGLSVVGNSRNQDARLYAHTWSGASATQRSDAYYMALERYSTSDQYNEDIEREAERAYPDDPAQQRTYAAKNGYYGTLAWNWGSDSLRLAYWGLRSDARGMLHTAAFFLGAAVLNRVVSAIDVGFFTPVHDPHSSSRFPLSTLNRFAALPILPALDRPGLALYYRF